MILYLGIINVFHLLSVVLGDCSLTFKLKWKESEVIDIDTSAVSSFMHCIELCLYGSLCEAVRFNPPQCVLYSKSDSVKDVLLVFHVQKFVWPKRFISRKWKKEKQTYSSTMTVTEINSTAQTPLSTLLPLTRTSVSSPVTLTTGEPTSTTAPTSLAMTTTTLPTTTAAITTTVTTASVVTTTSFPTSTASTPPTKTTSTTVTTTSLPTAAVLTSIAVTTSTPVTTILPAATTSTSTAMNSTLLSTTTYVASTISPSAKMPTVVTSVSETGQDVAKTLRGKCPEHRNFGYLNETVMCVRYIDGKKRTWSEARNICMADGGDLAKLSTPERYDSCYNYIVKIGKGGLFRWGTVRDKVWMGLMTSPNGSKWVDGSPVNFTKLKKKPTSAQCGQFGTGFLKMWFSKKCNSKSTLALCEIV